MGWLGRSLGQFGSDIGEGYDINQQWKQRAQQMALEQARQKQEELKFPLELQELQQRVRQMGVPQYEGTTAIPGGGLGAISREPTTGAIRVNNIVQPYVTAESVGRQILNARGALSPADQGVADQYIGNLRQGMDPLKVMEDWQRFYAGAAKAQKQKRPTVDLPNGRVTTYDPWGNVGQEYDIFDAKGSVKTDLPPEIRDLVTSNMAAQERMEALRMRGEIDRADEAWKRMLAQQAFQEKKIAEKDVYDAADKALGQFLTANEQYRTIKQKQTMAWINAHIFEPWTLWNSSNMQDDVDAAEMNAEGLRQEAIRNYVVANRPIPGELSRPVGSEGIPTPTHPPPPGTQMLINGKPTGTTVPKQSMIHIDPDKIPTFNPPPGQ